MDNLTKEQRRKNMQNIRSQDTLPEKMVEMMLRVKKIYFARNVKTILGKPDFVFRKKKLLVFVDSGFWHGHPKRCIMPKSNRSYWKKKIEGNILRDRKVTNLLKAQGWRVLRIWEFDIKNNPERIMEKISDLLN